MKLSSQINSAPKRNPAPKETGTTGQTGNKFKNIYGYAIKYSNTVLFIEWPEKDNLTKNPYKNLISVNYKNRNYQMIVTASIREIFILAQIARPR